MVESDDEMSPHALVGFQLYGEDQGLIGTIKEVHDYAGNLLISVDYQGKEVLIPLNEELIIRIDEDHHEIELDIADGLFDLDEE